MYKRNAQGWSKHFDFIIWEEISLQLAFVLAAYIRLSFSPYTRINYRNLAVVLALIDAIVIMYLNTMHNVLKRDILQEISKTVKQCLIVFALAAVYMFLLHIGDRYSRAVISITFILHILIGFSIRMIWKRVILRFGLPGTAQTTMLAVLDPQSADYMMGRLLDNSAEGYKIIGVILSEECGREEVGGIPVVSSLENAASYISQKWVDAVYVDCSAIDPRIVKLMEDCHQMAITVHYHIPYISREGVKQFAEKIGGTTVLTTSISYATPVQLFMKRCMDLIGGLVGSLLALIIMLIVGPMIKHASPGPILYTQERVGMNGKRFRIYKLRSMYMNADQDKQDLMEQNRVKDGMMFKLEFDPRIIGNKILPDGTRKTGLGEFIRRTSLDEFPQFFNVLAGQMSLVGTRPPTVDEWEKYEFHHRARLACKPGITGLWQVSGRSEITDFEEVVRLDTQYITGWSFSLDIRILLKTVVVVLAGRGAM